MSEAVSHQQLILETFTRTAAAFAEMPAHSDAASLALMLNAAEVGSGDTVLDVACGPGIVACAAAARGAHVTGIDFTPDMIEQARRLQRSKGLSDMEWQVGDAMALPFEAGAFSVVMSRYAFHHLQEPGAVLREMARVCKAGGRVVITDVFTVSKAQGEAYDRIEKLRDPSHVRALLFEDVGPLFENVGASVTTTEFYRLPVALEDLLAASMTAPAHGEEIRRLLGADIGKNETGMAPHREGEAIHFSFPVVIVVGKKR